MGKVASLTVTLLLWGLSPTFLSLGGNRAVPQAEAAALGDMAEEMHETMQQAAEGLQGAMQDVEEQVEDLAGNVVENMKAGLGNQGEVALENSMEVGTAGAYDYAGSSEAAAGIAGGPEVDYEAQTAEGLEAEHEAGETGQLQYQTADYHSGEVTSNADINAAYSSAAQDAMSAGNTGDTLNAEASAETGQYEASVEQPEAVEVPTDPYLDVAAKESSEEEEEEVEGQESHEEAALSGSMTDVQNVNALAGNPLARNVIGEFSLKEITPSGNGLPAMPSSLPGVQGLSGMTASGSFGPVLNPSALPGFPTLPPNLPPLPANLPPLPANLPPLPGNMPPLPGNLPPLPGNLPPLPANLPPLPANLPPLPSNLPPLPANLPALPNMPPLPAGLPPFPGLPGRRRKRAIVPIARAAFTIGRQLFGKFGRTHATQSANRVTQHYAGKGNYQAALKDFRSMKPTDVRPFSSGKISGQTGKVGDYRVTVRDGSTKGESRPTISVHHKKQPDKVRKFRYNP